MAGQLAVTARKSIPVENRSGRLFSTVGVGALVIATSQWAHWMGYADWDLLSLIPGFAQVSGLLPNAYADGRVFDCPNKTLGAEIALMSDDMLQTVGKTLCTKEELIAASLRGSDGRPRLQSAALVRQSAESIILPMMPIMSVIVPPPRLTMALPIAPATPAVHPFTMASIEPVRRDPNRDLIETINRRARQIEDLDPCAGAKSAVGCEFENPGSGNGGSSDGGSSGPGSGSGGDGSGIDDEDHSGSGGESSSGSGGDDSDWTDNGGSGGGSDGGEGGESGGGSHGGDGSDSHGGDGGDSHGGDGGEGGDSHGGDSSDSHGGSGDSGGSDGGESDGGSHDGGDTHEIADNSDGGETEGRSSHDSGDDHLDSGDSADHSGSSGGSGDNDREDSDSSHSGGDGGEGGEGGSSGSSGSGRSGGHG